MFAIVASSGGAGAGAGGVFVALILVLMGIGAYFIPTIVAFIRKVPNMGSVVVINLFLGWTFIGWVVALAMAARSGAQSPAAASGWQGPAYGSPTQPADPAQPPIWP